MTGFRKRSSTMPTWYDQLKKPPFTPPKEIFGKVWAVLYLFIIASLAAYYLAPLRPMAGLTTAILVLHFSASFSWTTLFFRKKRILPALLDIILIDTSLALLMFLFARASTLAALLLVPYFFWGLFAAYLNWGIWRLNR